MKTIGLIGGMSWESSAIYYNLINKGIANALGGLHSAKSIMYTVDFEEIANLQRKDDWNTIAERMSEAARTLQSAGADFVLICCNTQYKVAAEIESTLDVPLIHIGDATAEAVQKQSLKKIGLLGTKYTMEQDFIKNRFTNKGIAVVVPDDADRVIIQDVIYNELGKGIINPKSREAYLLIIEKLVADGAQGIVLGCTEIGMLVKKTDTLTPLFDTTIIHAEKAVELALAN